MEAKFLICDCVGNAELVLNEAKEKSNGRITFHGPFSETDRQNRNRRIYPAEVFKPEFDRLAKIVERKGLVGELDHPENSIIHMDRAAFRIDKMWWETPTVGHGQCTTIGTPIGLTLEAFFHEGIPVGISSRGVGNGQTDENGITVIKNGFKLITYDTVADPSFQDAWQQIAEQVERKLHTTTVSMATPEMIRQNGMQSTGGYHGPVVKTRIEEAISQSLQESATSEEDKAKTLLGAFSNFFENFTEKDLA